ATHSTKAWMNFMVVKSMSPYNGIIGQTTKTPSDHRRRHPLHQSMDELHGGEINNTDSISGRDTPQYDKKKGQAPERVRAIQVEVQKMVDARIMREVYYHDWLSNPVMVKKHDESWRMCVDFTDLNRACPQDCYPLP
nr:reverse transcriptase domain-containing protein [Tanacetum cinerariifolium]